MFHLNPITLGWMKSYLRVLAILYLFGGILHLLDLMDLRLKFSEMPTVWKTWIVYLFALDLLAAAGLWKRTQWGVNCFLLVAFSQVIAYVGFSSYFGQQFYLVAFHVITLAFYFFLKYREARALSST